MVKKACLFPHICSTDPVDAVKSQFSHQEGRVMIAIVADFQKASTIKYDERGARYMPLEASHTAERI